MKLLSKLKDDRELLDIYLSYIIKNYNLKDAELVGPTMNAKVFKVKMIDDDSTITFEVNINKVLKIYFDSEKKKKKLVNCSFEEFQNAYNYGIAIHEIEKVLVESKIPGTAEAKEKPENK